MAGRWLICQGLTHETSWVKWVCLSKVEVPELKLLQFWNWNFCSIGLLDAILLDVIGPFLVKDLACVPYFVLFCQHCIVVIFRSCKQKVSLD